MKTEESKLESQQEQLDIPVMHSYTPNYLHFMVYGAGVLKISEECKWSCGGEEGFSFDVEWGRYGFTGGVLPKEEARKLAEHILNALK